MCTCVCVLCAYAHATVRTGYANVKPWYKKRLFGMTGECEWGKNETELKRGSKMYSQHGTMNEQAQGSV